MGSPGSDEANRLERAPELRGESRDPAVEAWLRNVEKHAKSFTRFRRVMRNVPSDPRCHVCYSPFGGPGGAVLRAFGRRPSKKNPNLCSTCVEDAPPGGVVDVSGVLFGDVRGFTALAESRSPAQLTELVERFYDVATRAVIDHDGIVDKLVGDEVMGLFWPPVMPGPACEAMVAAAEDLLTGVGYGSADGPWLPVGVGLDYGEVKLGNLGTGRVRDFTALGDVVNTAARLQASAAGGEILMSARVYAAVRERYPDAGRRELNLKGKSAPTTAYVIARAATTARASNA